MPLLNEKMLTEGKTKKIFQIANTKNVLVEAKDDITAGDGKKHNLIEGKARLATTTTCNVFELLDRQAIPLAFKRRVDSITFEAHGCDMFPYEVVNRDEAHGSSLKRDPTLTKGHRFPETVTEFYLKTKGRKWKDHDLPCDDPLIKFWRSDDQSLILGLHLFLPDKPIAEQEPFLRLHPDEVFKQKGEYVGDYREEHYIAEMERLSKEAFRIVAQAWARLDRKMVDWKVEFGLDSQGILRLADVIDNDSWRVLEDGKHIDKQSYRDGEDINEVTAKYRKVAELTSTPIFLFE